LKKFTLIGLLLLTIILASCSGENSQPSGTMPPRMAGLTNPLGPEAVTQGASLYKLNCETCHGIQGYGDGPAANSLDPHPVNLVELSSSSADDFLFWKISIGSPGTSMAAWSNILTDEQIWQVITFIRSLK